MITRLQIILPPKVPFFVCQNVNISKFCKVSSKINIFITTTSFRRFVSFSSKNEILWSLVITEWFW